MSHHDETKAQIAAIQDTMDPGYVKRRQIGELALDLARKLDAVPSSQENDMTQTERTEAVIAALPREAYDVRDLIVHTRIIEQHARELAAKLDTIMRFIRTQEISYGAMSEIRRVYDEGIPNAQA